MRSARLHNRNKNSARGGEEKSQETIEYLPERIKKEIYEQRMEEDMKNMVPRRLHPTQTDEIGEKIVSLQNRMVDLYTDPKFKPRVY